MSLQLEELPSRDASRPAERTDGLPATEAPTGSLVFVKGKKGKWRPEKEIKLRNSLLASVGLLEIANAGDFAANVFNTNPLPVYARVFMALGGVVALVMIYFAVRDALLSLQNLRGLSAERQYVKSELSRYVDERNHAMLRTLDVLLEVNRREMGTEVVDRVGMDVLLGIGALFVGIGTFMAMDSGDPSMYNVSNLLTGYIGNAPCALYGLLNLSWSIHVWRRASLHKTAALNEIRDRRFRELLQMRASSVQFHGALNGITGIVAGVAALVTATMWWGYVVLAPCLATSYLVNMFWRKRVGYDRPLVRDLTYMDEEALLDALTVVDDCHRRYSCRTKHDDDPLSALVSNPASISSVMEFIMENQLFEQFCLRILCDADLTLSMFPEAGDCLSISWRHITSMTDEVAVAKLLKMARELVRAAAPQCFRHQERYILESLGCAMFTTRRDRVKTARARTAAAALDPRRDNRHYRNAHADIGRHTNDWLFGGFSIRNAFIT